MKRQIVLENDQLIEMVNESAKRVLRNLMTEDFWGPMHDSANDLADRFGVNNEFGEVSPEVINALKTLANSENGRDILNAFDDHAEEGFHRLCVQHPEIITTLATNPTLAYNMTRDNNFVTNLCNNEQLAQQFGADANSVAAQYGYGTEAQGGMGFVQQGAGGGAAGGGTNARVVYDQAGNAYFLDANNQPIQGVQMFYDASGNPLYFDGNGNPITVDDGQGTQGVQGVQNPNAVSQEQSSQFMMAGFTANQQEIDNLTAQLSKMKETDPNYQKISQRIQELQYEQDAVFKPGMQKYYGNMNDQYNTLMQKMANGTATQQDYMDWMTVRQNLAALKEMPGYDQFSSAPTTQNQVGYGTYMNGAQPMNFTTGTNGARDWSNMFANQLNGNNGVDYSKPAWMSQQSNAKAATTNANGTQATNTNNAAATVAAASTTPTAGATNAMNQGANNARRQPQPGTQSRQNVNNTYNRNKTPQGGAPKPAPKPAQPVQPAPQPEQPTTVVNPTPQPQQPQNRVMNPQPAQQPQQPAQQPQQQPGQPAQQPTQQAVVNHGANANANAAQTLKNPNSAALNNTLGNKVAGTQFNYNPQQFKGVNIPQNLHHSFS